MADPDITPAELELIRNFRHAQIGNVANVPTPIPWLHSVSAQCWAVRDEANGGGDVIAQVSAVVDSRELKRWGFAPRDLLRSQDPADFGESWLHCQAFEGDDTENPWQALGYGTGASGGFAGGVGKSLYHHLLPPDDDQDPEYEAQTATWLEQVDRYPILTTRLQFTNALGAGPGILDWHPAWTGHALIIPCGPYASFDSNVTRRWTPLYVPLVLQGTAFFVAP